MEKTTGIISFSLFGIQAALSASEAQEWGQVLMGLAPLALIIFLAVALWKMNRKYEEVRVINGQLNEKILLLYAAVQDRQARCRLPSPSDFDTNNFELSSIVPQNKLP